jgi:hypothetical protein
MPKTFPNTRKERWVEQLSQGRSVKQIARSSKCDVRTVKRAIEEIRNKRAAQEALTQLYQQALREHMSKLNETLDMIIEELHLPSPYVTELAWNEVTLSLMASSEVEEAKDSEQSDDVLSNSALLAEHLKNSKPWRSFADWNRNLKKHRNACGQLQKKALSVLLETTGLMVRNKGDETTSPFLHVENTGDLLCRGAIQQLVGIENAPNLDKELVVDNEHGMVRHYTTVLVEGFKDANKLSECRDKIVESFKMVKDSPETAQVLSTFQQLEKTLPKARNELRAIRLLGVVPGHCRLCRQFGL